MRAAMARVHGGMGGGNCAGEERGAVAALLGRVDDCAAVHPSRAAWMAAEPVRHGWSHSSLAA